MRSALLPPLLSVVLLLGGCLRAGFDEARGINGDGGGSDATACLAKQQLLQITDDDDDGEQDYDGAWLKYGERADADPAGIFMGYWIDKVSGYTWGYFRFTLSAAIPAGASELKAELGLHGQPAPVSSAGWVASQHALRILVENAASAAQVTDSGQCPTCPAARPVIGAARWPASGGLAWDVTGYNRTTAPTPAIQLLVQKHGGLAAGAGVQLWISADFTGVQAEVATGDASLKGYHPAELKLSWCE